MLEALEVTPHDAQFRLNARTKASLIDVREAEEFAVASIEGSSHIPMRSVPGELPRLKALADETDLLVLCHHGVRSLQVVDWLREHGIGNCFSVAGGIDRWSREIDPAVPRY